MTTPEPPHERMLPFLWLWPVVVGALVGVGLRLVFMGRGGEPYAAMTGVFIVCAPVLVGAVTVYVAETQRRRSWGYYAAASAAANGLFVLATLAILIEGMICVVLILPLAILLGVAGALLMGAICRYTNWPKHTLSCIALIPLLLGGVDSDVSPAEAPLHVERAVVIDAPAEVVWGRLLNATDIRPEEVRQAWLYRIGVPLPLDGRMLDDTVRRVRMAKDVYFDEIVQEARPNELIRWTYRFYADSFPPYAFDEHVIIGGRYFDVLDTSYTLIPNGGTTEVRVSLGFRVNTRFNWYAKPVARFMLGNLLESNLNYYRRRSETDTK